MAFDAVAEIFFAEGIDVVFEGTTAKGYVDTPDQLAQLGDFQPGVIKGQYVLLFATTSLPGLKAGLTLTADGVKYRVSAIRALDDGKISQADLSRA